MKYLFLVILLLSACTVENNLDEEFRIDVLYEHTIQMRDYADDALLDRLGLDMYPFEKASINPSYEEKLRILAQAYGTRNTDINYLETRMEEMMNDWVELTYEK